MNQQLTYNNYPKLPIFLKLIFIRILFLLLATLCLTPLISAPTALFLGIIFSLIFNNPFLKTTQKLSTLLLQFSVICLGAGMSLEIIGHEIMHGLIYTITGIIVLMLLGTIIGKTLKIKPNISLLITAGTAICGGSAIAAIAPVIRAKPNEISISLAIIFLLNASALFIFTPLGHYFHLTQIQFGFLSALAIHDTSSVIGAALQYGPQAVEIATTVKLTRALWIIPLAIIINFIWTYKQHQNMQTKTKFPFFIFGFIATAALVNFVPALQEPGIIIANFAKKTLVLTLFLIGSSFLRSTLKTVGIKPFLQGILLWIMMTIITLAAILLHLIH